MILNDHWTLDLEALGMKPAGEELARHVLTCRPPYAICVQGKWGSGKTSLMRYAMARLGGEPLGIRARGAGQKDGVSELPPWLQTEWEEQKKNGDRFCLDTFQGHLAGPELEKEDSVVVPIWFNPWQHQGTDSPIIALLQELRSQFGRMLRLERWVQKVGTVTIEAGLSTLAQVASLVSFGKPLGINPVQGARELGVRNEIDNFENVTDAQRLNMLFEQAVMRLVGVNVDREMQVGNDRAEFQTRRLVVFIDDLDRCADEQTVRLLEAIKLYLQTPYCVFVLGLDGAAVRASLCHVRGNAAQEHARDYIDKLFQATLYVPTPRYDARLEKDGRPSFLSAVAKASGLYALLLSVPEDERASARLLEKLDSKTHMELITNLVEPNPRRIKNFVASLGVAWRLRPADDSADREGAFAGLRLLILIQYLRHAHPDVYRLLAYSPANAQILHDVLSSERSGPDLEDPAPEALVMAASFRHAFAKVSGTMDAQGGGLAGKPPRTAHELDELLTVVRRRVDSHRSDRYFLRCWKVLLGETELEQIPKALEPYLT